MLFFWGGLDAHIGPDTVTGRQRCAAGGEEDLVNAEFSFADHGFFCDARASYNAEAAGGGMGADAGVPGPPRTRRALRDLQSAAICLYNLRIVLSLLEEIQFRDPVRARPELIYLGKLSPAAVATRLRAAAVAAESRTIPSISSIA